MNYIEETRKRFFDGTVKETISSRFKMPLIIGRWAFGGCEISQGWYEEVIPFLAISSLWQLSTSRKR